MSTNAKPLRSYGITPIHGRPGVPSTIEMHVLPEARKSGRPDFYLLTEDEAFDLSQMALTAANILRRTRLSRERLAEAERLDRDTAARGLAEMAR